MSDPADKDFLETLGRRLRRLRERAGLTQEQLAEVGKLQPESVSRIETGAVSPGLSSLRRLARALDVPLGDLVDGERPVGADALSGEEREVVEAWRDLGEQQRDLARRLLSELARRG